MVGPPTRGPPSPAPIFGREEVLEALDQLLLRAKEGGSHGCLVAGGRGAGKTVLLDTAVHRARDRGFSVLRGRSLPEELPSPFSLVRDLLGSRDRSERERVETDQYPGDLPVFLAPLPPPGPFERPPSRPRSGTATEPSEFDRVLEALGAGGVIDGPSAREELLGKVEEYVRTRTGNRPNLLAIDDLHFADASSLEFLRRLAHDEGSAPTVIVATVGVDEEVPFRNRAPIAALRQSPTMRAVALRSFTLPEATQFVRYLYGGRDPNPHDVLRWQSQTDGNPLFLEQLVRIATGYGAHRYGEGSLAGGRDVNQILLALFGGLDEEDRNLLTYGSVLGKEFRVSDIAAAEGKEPKALTSRLETLAQDGFVRSKGADVYEFVTDSLRASIYSNATETRRRILHRKAGLALESGGRAGSDELARQFYLGRDDERAVKYNLAAAEAASRSFAFEDAWTHVSRALESQRRRTERDPRIEVRLLTEEGRLLVEMGNLRQAEGVLSEALLMTRSRPGEGPDLVRALLILAECRSRRGEYAGAAELASEAERLLEPGSNPRDRMEVYRVKGRCALRQSELAQAEAHHRNELEIAERSGTLYDQARALFNLASTMLVMGMARYDEAFDLFARAADRFGSGEDFGARASVLNNRALLEWTSAGRKDDALRDLTLALEAAERSRSRTRIGYILNNLAQLNVELGRVEPARSAFERAVRVLAPVGDEYMDQQLSMSRGMIAAKDGKFEAAEAAYQEALAQARNLHQPAETAEVMMRLAELAHDRGDDTSARRWMDESRANHLLDYRPDFSGRVQTLEAAIAGPRP